MHKLRKPYLRCYAERDRDGSWFAMCVDLNLYARADTFEDAQQRLKLIVAEYVSEALEDDRQYARELLNRRAPATFWLKYYLIKALCKLRDFNGRDSSSNKKNATHIPFKTLAPA